MLPPDWVASAKICLKVQRWRISGVNQREACWRTYKIELVCVVQHLLKLDHTEKMVPLAPGHLPLHHWTGCIKCADVRLANPENLWGCDLSNITKSGFNKQTSSDLYVQYFFGSD